MTSKDDGGAAFASNLQRGMSLRDYFAGQALMGMNANGYWSDVEWEQMAKAAYDVADAMLAAREGGGE